MRGVTGDGTWDRLPGRTRAFLANEGGGALVDVGMPGLEPDGLGRIRVPVTLLTGGASEPFYEPIVEALVEHIRGARHVHLPRLTHASPITEPAPIAEAVISALAAVGVIAFVPSRSRLEETHA
jgi:pimeloyl-ACP methyl ester carboxylesterase